MLSQADLKHLLAYNKKTGVFTWRVRRNWHTPAGSVAGSADKDGYVCIRVRPKIYKAHRLAFLYVLGWVPECKIDHRNGNVSDNTWKNLRPADNYENGQNMKLKKSNTTGHMGVCIHQKTGKPWARITVNGVRHSLGIFDTVEEAGAAYLAAKKVGHVFQPIPRHLICHSK